MRMLPESRRATAVLLLITLALGACALEFTVHVNSSVQHFVVYWLYNGLVLSAGAVCIARGLAHSRERAAWVLIGAAVVSWGVGNTIWTFAYVESGVAALPFSRRRVLVGGVPASLRRAPVVAALTCRSRPAQRLARRRHRQPGRRSSRYRGRVPGGARGHERLEGGDRHQSRLSARRPDDDRVRGVGAGDLRVANRPRMGIRSRPVCSSSR